MGKDFSAYAGEIGRVLRAVEVTDAAGKTIDPDEAVSRCVSLARATHERGNKLMFIGNGGSAGIASHVAIDYAKNGNLRALAFNDPAALTCLANDLGYENVFAKQVEMHGRPGDLLVAISSSGRSPNILAAAAEARRVGCGIVTLSGFAPDNPLRRAGEVNFYLKSSVYGFVEIGHLAIVHSILDIAMGYKAP